jgi:hypothetical protein
MLAAGAGASLATPAPAAANVAPRCNSVPASPDSPALKVYAGAPYTVQLYCVDSDGDQVTISVVDGPDHGGTVEQSVSGGATWASYTPSVAYVGPERFAFRATDGQVESELATVAFDVQRSVPICQPSVVKVRSGNTALIGPMAHAPGATRATCDSPLLPTTFTVTKQPAHGSLTGDPAGGWVTYRPDDGFSGTDTVSFTLGNRAGTSAEATQEIEVGPNVNNTPECGAGSMTVRAGQSRNAVLSCWDADEDALTYAVDRTGTAGAVGAPTVTAEGQNVVRYTAPAQPGEDRFAVTATDAFGGRSAPETQSVTVRAASYNTAPQCYAQSTPNVEAGRPSTYSIEPSCYDAEGDPLTFKIDTPPAHGTAVVKAGGAGASDTVEYTAADDGFRGEDSFVVHAVDRPGSAAQPAASEPVTQKAKIVAPKPANECFEQTALRIRPGTERMWFLNCINWTGIGGALKYQVVSQPAHGTVRLAFEATIPYVYYKADKGYLGEDSFSYRASNGAGVSSTLAQTVDVTADVNDAPQCMSGQFPEPAHSGRSRTVVLQCNDTDSDRLTYEIADGPAHGTLSAVTQPQNGGLLAVATVAYTPDVGYTGPDSFTLTASDGRASSGEPVRRFFTVTPAAANTAPQCYAGAVKVAANGTTALAPFSASCFDADGDAVVASITRGPQHGTLSAPDARGMRTYTPDDPAWTGTDTIAFEGSDGSARSAATLEITVTEPSEIVARPVSTPAGGAVRLQNYVDADGRSRISVPRGDVAQFDGACMPLDLGTKLAEDGGTIDPASVKLVLTPSDHSAPRSFDMARDPDGTWQATVDCAASGDLRVDWVYTDGDGSHPLSKPLGGITLIDPQGVVYDKRRYDIEVARGATPTEARSRAAIEGAVVTLQRYANGVWTKVPAGDPGISPNVNPQVTGADGVYQWDVSAGTYRVVVAKTGYPTVTSRAVTVPPPVLDLHIAMAVATGPPAGGGTTSGGGGPGTPVAQRPVAPKPTPAPAKPAPAKPSCGKLKGAKKAACTRAAALKKALASCAKLKGAKKSTCIRRARALDRCVPLKRAKKASCIRRAKAIGRKR